MRKATVLLSVFLALAVSTSANAAKKKRHVAAPAVVNVDATDAQRAKFFQDAMNPLGLK